MQRKIALVSNCIYDELHVAYDLDWSSGKTVTILCRDIKNRGSGPSRGGCLFICNHSIKNSLLIYIWPLSNSNIHCVSKETLLYILPLVNNQMNIIIKIICPRKFQQTDRVQLAAPVQLQHEDHLQVFRWWLRCLTESCNCTNNLWISKHFFAVTLRWRPTGVFKSLLHKR